MKDLNSHLYNSIKKLDLITNTYIAVYFINSSSFWLEIVQNDTLFIFNQKQILSRAIQKNSEEIILLKFTKNGSDDLSSIELKKINQFKNLLKEFDIRLVKLCTFNEMCFKEFII